jgi:hypothetical protein
MTFESLPLVVFSASLGWLILSAPQGGMSELLAPCWEWSTIKWRLCNRGRFLTTGEPLPPVVFSAFPGWLILSAPWDGMPELLAPCWEESTYKWKLYIWEFLHMASAITLLSSCSIIIPWELGNKSHHRQSPMWVEGINTMEYCLVPWRDRLWHCYHHLSVMQPSAQYLTPWLRWTVALFTVRGRYPPPRRGCQGLDFGGEERIEKDHLVFKLWSCLVYSTLPTFGVSSFFFKFFCWGLSGKLNEYDIQHL